ncbi:MAG: N-acetylmuramoyl-L-alanine amidase [Verrucomicrobiaceae bacterium]|nr:MAG: N-acetylmuramoyl-L-alanine amidase [Verrucomicrobiaceae bacterium]
MSPVYFVGLCLSLSVVGAAEAQTIKPPALSIAGPADTSLPIVAIDPGHGGHDYGSVSSTGLREKDISLQIAFALRDALVKTGKYRVLLTRSDDRFLVLQERYGLARQAKADIFLSIHMDSAGNAEASGMTIYTLSEVASDKEAARLAARENKADVIAGVDLSTQTADISSILIDLTRRETMNGSAQLARILIEEARPHVKVKDNAHRMASLIVLKAPDMVSLLIEPGYISNRSDSSWIEIPENRKKFSEAMVRGIDRFFGSRRRIPLGLNPR